ncbi:hypothetical protein GGH94_003213 [Coemansia aciculifera]|uniref:Pentacotripeptide-repeat region of PRORP domain-containing protein n=2 Tax=Coemansia TaxID=4863 RepID=A0A9W8IP73_9FUNG|nr:hypothetical protein GGH94_003213 [Coemansia aciculifera]
MPHLTTWQHVQRCASNLIPKASVQSGHAVRYAPCAVLVSDLANRKVGALLASARRRQPFHSACTSSTQRQNIRLTHSDQSPEERLLAQLHQLSRTGARAQREAVWGLYQRLNKEQAGIHTFAPSTVLQLLELLGGDNDELRALARISAVVRDISGRRQLTEQEVNWVQRICRDIDEGRLPSISRSIVENVERLSLDQPTSRSSRSKDFTTLLPLSSSEPAANLDGTFPEVAQLRQLLSNPPIAVDPTQVWRLYRTAIAATLADGRRRLAREDMRALIIYCSSLGSIAGRRFLAQIETDVTTDPLLYPARFRVLLTTYAKLGLLDDARRCYQDALQSEFLPLTSFEEFSMCQALLRSSRHKEGRALFDKLTRTGQARSFMYDMMIREYVLTWNTEMAFALLEDMRRRDIEPTLNCFCVLATACTLDSDAGRSSKRLSDLIACMKSWGCAPDKRFFVATLKGYHWSGQHSMFDGLLQRLRAHGLGSDAMLGKVAMMNASERMHPDLTVAMARVAAQAPENIPKVVQVLSQMGLTSELSACVDLAQYPDNNLTANARLCILLGCSKMAADPQALVDEVTHMIECGFTPSFRLFFRTIRHIRLHGGLHLAIRTYTVLVAAGVPTGIELLFFVLQMHLEARDSVAAIATYEELRERLRDSDFTRLCIYGPTMEKLVLVLIESRGIVEARQALDFLSGLPVNRQYLPYSSLIEYYVNHKMLDESHGLAGYVVQHDISLKPRTVNLYCRYLASRSSTTDFANFLRYVQRTHSLRVVSDDILGAFFALCALEHKVADLEWIIGVMSSMHGWLGAWSAAIDRLAEVDSQLLPFVVHTAINVSQNQGRTAMDLLEGTAKSPFREVVADLVLTTLEAHGTMPPRYAYEKALTTFTQSWLTNYSSPRKAANVNASEEFVIKALRRYIAPAVKVGIPALLLTITMQALSSTSRTAYMECLDFLSGMSPELLDARFYCAIAGSCSHYGSVEGVDSVFEAMRQRGIALTASALLSLLHCYANVKPPRELQFEQSIPPPTTHDLRLDTQISGSPLDITPQSAAADEYAVDAASPADSALTVDVVEDDQMWLGHSKACRVTGFYSTSLAKVMSIWKEFEYLDLPVSGSGYAVVARAHINAGEYQAVEALFVEMVDRGIPHSEITAALWIQSRLMQDDTNGALEIFSAIGNSTRCAALAQNNWCFNTLDEMQRTPRQFSVIIRYYLARGEIAKASAIMSAMHKSGLVTSTKLYVEVLRRLAQSGKHEAIVDMLRQMAKVGVSMDAQLMDAIRGYSSNRRTLESTSTTDADDSGSSEDPGERPQD